MRVPWRFQRVTALALLLGATVIVAGCGGSGERKGGVCKGTVNVAYAGSLTNLMEHTLGPAFQQATGYTYQGKGAGSTAIANQIAGKLIHPDVFISASAALTRPARRRQRQCRHLVPELRVHADGRSATAPRAVRVPSSSRPPAARRRGTASSKRRACAWAAPIPHSTPRESTPSSPCGSPSGITTSQGLPRRCWARTPTPRRFSRRRRWSRGLAPGNSTPVSSI